MDDDNVFDFMAEKDKRSRKLDELAELPPESRTRTKLKETADALDLSVSDVRAAIKERERERETREAADDLLADVEPWPDEVAGADLLDELADAAQRYIVLSDHVDVAMALWTVHSYGHDAAEHSPILAFSSPDKRCGKTTALNFLAQVARRPLPSANITAAALFRATEKFQPTLLIDEADTFLRQSDELRGILNSGHAKASAYVIRTVGDDYEPRQFRTWAPKAIALIGNMPATLADRSILVPMRRKRETETVERLRSGNPDLLELARRCARWVADTGLNADPELPAGLNDRAADNWRPLLAIADAVGGPWPEYARKAAAVLSGGVEDESARTQLLTDFRVLFRERDRWPSADVVARLVDMEDRPWPEWKHGKPITTRQVARLLADYDIKPRVLRLGTGTARGYQRDQFEDAFSRYLPDRSVTPSQPNTGAGFSDFQSVTPEKPVTDEKPRKAAPQADCDGVTDENGVPGEYVPGADG